MFLSASPFTLSILPAQDELGASLKNGVIIKDVPETPPPCDFAYGFDALQYVAKFIAWSHPDAIEERLQEKLSAYKRLKDRSSHAQSQLEVAAELRTLALNQSSGILWGPFTTPLSPTSVGCVVKTLKLGTVLFQISDTVDFIDIISIESSTEKRSSATSDDDSLMAIDDILPVKIIINDLQPDTDYYVRCALKDSPAPLFLGTDGDFFQMSQFHTLPLEDEEATDAVADPQDAAVHKAVSVICFGDIPVTTSLNRTLEGVLESIPSPALYCVLGDILQSDSAVLGKVPTQQDYSRQLSTVYAQSSCLNKSSSLFRKSSLLLGWRDTMTDAARFVRYEERMCQKWIKDVKKWLKKYSVGSKSKSKSKGTKTEVIPPPPTLTRPPLANSLQSVIEVRVDPIGII